MPEVLGGELVAQAAMDWADCLLQRMNFDGKETFPGVNSFFSTMKTKEM